MNVLATQHVEGLLRIYIVVVCKVLIRMSPKAKAASRGSAAAQTEGAPRLMQGMEQAMDVQLADVHCDQQPPNERVAPPGCAPGGARHSSRHVDRAHGSRHSTADAEGNAEAPDPTSL